MSIKELIAFLFGMVVATLVTSSIAHHEPKHYVLTWTGRNGELMLLQYIDEPEIPYSSKGPSGTIEIKERK